MSLKDYVNMEKFTLPYDGYWGKEKLSTYAGIYYVFATKLTEEGKLIGKRLVYIGEADNIRERHNGTKAKPKTHEHLQDFNDELKDGETLRYDTSKFEGSEEDRKMIEAAMIYAIKPAFNIKNTVSYNDKPICVDIEKAEIAYFPYKKIQLTKGSNDDWKVLKLK